VFNDAGADVDFRVEGDTDANLLFVDAGNDRVGIGTSSPANLFEVSATSAGGNVFLARLRNAGTTTGTQASLILTTNTSTGGNPVSTAISTIAENATGNTAFTIGTAIAGASPAERMRITSDGYLRMASGSGGIQFNGDTAAANALDDYEEGTWIPVIGGSDAPTGQTYTTQDGRYIKIGKLVHAQFTVTLSAKGTMTGGSGWRLRGFPFAANTSTTGGGGIINLASGLSANLISMWISPASNSTLFFVGGSGAAASSLDLFLTRATYISDTTSISGSIVYEVN
jgi:hypothetical protein